MRDSLPEAPRIGSNFQGFEVYGEVRLVQDAIALYIHAQSGGIVHVVAPVNPIVQKSEPHLAISDDPSLVLQRKFAERLITELWRLGIRPTIADLRPREGEVEAIKYHLEDMRRLAFAGGKRLVYNKTTRKIDVVSTSGVVMESLDPPQEIM